MNQLLESNQETYFSWWCEELLEEGYLKNVTYQPKEFLLSEQAVVEYAVPHKKKDGCKYVPEEILPQHIYTPDAKLVWDANAINWLTLPLTGDLRKKKNRSFQTLLSDVDHYEDDFVSWVEVKPAFDQNNMTRLFKLNQKWVFQNHGIFVNLTIPDKLFEKTFTPERYLRTDKTDRPRTIKYKNVILLKDFVKQHEKWMKF